MGEVNRFVSQFTNRFDSKGRLSVPAPFRTVMTRDGFGGLYLCQSLYQPALDCGGHGFLEDVEALLAGLSPHSAQWDVLATAVYAPSEIVKVDGEGRILLSDAARHYAELTDAAVFVGLGQKFQIWEPTRFAAHLAEAKRQVRERRAEFGPQGTAGPPLVQPLRGARE